MRLFVTVISFVSLVVGLNCQNCCSNLYTVVSGDYLNAIASSKLTTTNAILACNPSITNPSLIFPGQVLSMPSCSSSGSSGSSSSGSGSGNCCSNSYTVVSGDYLNAIASSKLTTTNAILACNPSITNPSLIFPGQVLSMPSCSSSGPGTNSPANPLVNGNCGQGYTAFVAPAATTVYQIATMFCANPSSSYQSGIIAYNNIANSNAISANQIVCVPNNCNTGATGTPSSVSCPAGYSQVSPPANTNLATLASNYCSASSPNFATFLNGVAAYNGLVNTYTIYGYNSSSITTYNGQVLCIPSNCNTYTTTGTRCNAGFTPYTVQSGNTVTQIAGLFCSNPSQNYISAIITTNNLNTAASTNSAYLTPSSQICIPDNCNTAANGYGVVCPPGSVSFIFQSGNSLNNVAAQYCVNPTTGYMNSILAMNGNSQTNPMRPGEFMCIPTNCQAGTITTSGTACQYTYTVQAGDSLSSIAANCGISVSAIQTTNAAIGCLSSTVSVGQQLCLPSCNNPTSNYVPSNVATNPVSNPNIVTNNLNSGCSAYYMIKSGDTCASLSTYYPSLLSSNPNLNCANLVPGESVCVNGTLANALSPCDAAYMTKAGDTCASLAASYPQFYSLNPSINCCAGTISPGQYICLSQTRYNCQYSGNTGSSPTVSCSSFASSVGVNTATLFYCNQGVLTCNNYIPNMTLKY